MNNLLETIRKIAASETQRDAKLLEVCRAIKLHVKGCDWVGFYIVEGRELVLGPYVGAHTDHTRIGFGQGVCGQAAEARGTMVVDDVSRENNYLSCSIHVKSEIVIPLVLGEEIVAELDIDSHTTSAFDIEKRTLLEDVAKELMGLFQEELLKDN